MKIKWNVVFKFEAIGQVQIVAKDTTEAKDRLFEQDYHQLFSQCSSIKLRSLSITEDISEWEKVVKH